MPTSCYKKSWYILRKCAFVIFYSYFIHKRVVKETNGQVEAKPGSLNNVVLT